MTRLQLLDACGRIHAAAAATPKDSPARISQRRALYINQIALAIIDNRVNTLPEVEVR